MSPAARSYLLSSARVTRAPSQLRHFRASVLRNEGKKDDLMNRESMNTTSTEYSQSAGDAAAAHESEAFDPNSTRPEQEKKEGSERKGGDSENPLQVSPGNKEVSQDKGGDGNGQSKTQAEGKRGATSGAGSPAKGSKA